MATFNQPNQTVYGTQYNTPNGTHTTPEDPDLATKIAGLIAAVKTGTTDTYAIQLLQERIEVLEQRLRDAGLPTD